MSTILRVRGSVRLSVLIFKQSPLVIGLQATFERGATGRDLAPRAALSITFFRDWNWNSSAQNAGQCSFSLRRPGF
jgi:hypothetical protein